MLVDQLKPCVSVATGLQESSKLHLAFVAVVVLKYTDHFRYTYCNRGCWPNETCRKGRIAPIEPPSNDGFAFCTAMHEMRTRPDRKHSSSILPGARSNPQPA